VIPVWQEEILKSELDGYWLPGAFTQTKPIEIPSKTVDLFKHNGILSRIEKK
jgi:hypothetical protein